MSLRRSSRTSVAATDAISSPNGTPTTGNLPKKRARKSDTISSQVENGISADTVAMPPPSTPVKRRRIAKDGARPAPLTPTPSAIGVMIDRDRTSTQDGHAGVHTPTARPAAAHQTNATLVTPRGTRVAPHILDPITSASRSGGMTTTANLLKDACDHLIKIDPKFRPLIEKHQCEVFSAEGLAESIDPFNSLASGIISQQVSGAAAKSIKNKFIALYPAEQCPTGFPPPAIVAATDVARLRTAGLSQRKAEYIQGLAQKFADGELTVDMLMNGSDEEVMQRLVAVRGLGVWSVEMFMCFALKRMDVLSTGDLGVQRGMAAYVGKDVAKLKAKGGKWKYMSEQDMISISDKFRPYRSLFMWYMWRYADVVTDAIEES